MTARNKLLDYLHSNPDMLTPAQAARVEAMRKPQAQPGAFPVATGSPSVPAAALLGLAAKWEERAKRARIHEYNCRESRDHYGAHRFFIRACSLDAHASEVRRLVASATDRQPQENKVDSTT